MFIQNLIATSIANGNLTLSDYNNGNFYYLEGEYYSHEQYNKTRQYILNDIEEAENATDEETQERIEHFCSIYPYIK